MLVKCWTVVSKIAAPHRAIAKAAVVKKAAGGAGVAATVRYKRRIVCAIVGAGLGLPAVAGGAIYGGAQLGGILVPPPGISGQPTSHSAPPLDIPRGAFPTDVPRDTPEQQPIGLPEPSSMALLVAGLVALALLMRRGMTEGGE